VGKKVGKFLSVGEEKYPHVQKTQDKKVWGIGTKENVKPKEKHSPDNHDSVSFFSC